MSIPSLGKERKETSKEVEGSGDEMRPRAKAQWLDQEKNLDLDTEAVPSLPSIVVSA